MRQFKFILLAVLASITLIQCEKDDNSTDKEKTDTTAQDTVVSGTIIINASSKTTWAYFSFDKDTIVAISDSLASSSTDWDIAFNRVYIKTNGGLSGKGKAGVFNTNAIGKSGFETITSVTDTSTFAADDSVEIQAYNPTNPSQPIIYKKVLNPVLTNWYTMETNATATTIIPGQLVYIVKTAKGKYAKFYISSYYSNENVSGYYTINYLYRTDGSKNLK